MDPHAEYIIRPAKASDAIALQAIYEYYVLNTAVSFEYDAPTIMEMAGRILEKSEKYPYLVAEAPDNSILGFTYAGALRSRPAYNHCVEATIYLHKDERGKGIGRALYAALDEKLRAMGIANVYAIVTHTNRDNDPHQTNASEKFHTAVGFNVCGTFHNCGRKFGCEYDILWMEKFL